MKNPSVYYMGDRPYDNYEEYLEDLFAEMDIFLAKSANQELPFLRKRLKARGLNREQNIEDWQKMIGERRDFSLAVGIALPLEEALSAVKGDSFVRSILVLSMLMALQKGYADVLRALFADSQGQLEAASCVRLFWRDHANHEPSDLLVYEVVHHYYPCLCQLFPALEGKEDIGKTALVCDTRLLDILMGKSRYFPLGTAEPEPETVKSRLLFREDCLSFISGLLKQDDMPLILLWGPRGSGKRLLLVRVADKAERELIFFDASVNAPSGADFDLVKANLLFAARECVLFGKLLAVTGLEKLDTKLGEALAFWLDTRLRLRVPQIFMIYETEHYRNNIRCALAVEIGCFDEMERLHLWKHFLKGRRTPPDFTPEALANTFNMTPGQMEEAIRQAELMGQGELTEELLYQSCYVQLDHGLDEKAQRVKPAFGWNDLKLAPEDKEILRDVCYCVRTRHTVLRQWNFGKIVPYGGGITVLFSGPPGTGKTMAAQVIAKELHMELYKIDLSKVIDKYVGETEKNIKHIFEQAKKSNSVLFFDEADSIFNKRLEASGANERFANIESSLLLQCIEEYSGITILATNNFTSIDGAFIRRFKYYLLFKEPDEQIRYEIWQSVFPAEAPVNQEVDLRELAHIFEFTGAVIKNVVLAAAYLAAAQHREIRLIDILKAIRREMAKNNLVLTREKMGSLGYMFDEMIGNIHNDSARLDL